MLSVAIHQPNYLPWPGYFYKIHLSDIFVFLDDAQYSNKGMHNYNYIKSSEGIKKIKIPVLQTFGDKINKVIIKHELKWQEKHLRLMWDCYRKADYFDEVYHDLEKLLTDNQIYLADFNIHIIKYLCNKLAIKTEFRRSSELNISTVKEQRIIDICTSLDAKIYYSGIGAKAYQEEKNFLNNGIELKYSQYRIFEYKQQFKGFSPGVSIIDFLMNYGYRWDLIMQNQI